MSDRKLTIAVDFDGVIHNPLTREPGFKMGKPVVGAVDAMWTLVQQGHELIVHTVRAEGADGGHHVHVWLAHFGFPPPALVTSVKPDADVYLDDRAVRFVNWQHALACIEAEAQ